MLCVTHAREQGRSRAADRDVFLLGGDLMRHRRDSDIGIRGLAIALTVFTAVLVPVYWREYGPQNFLWFSDLALFAIVLGLWLRHPLLPSMTAVGVLALELLWAADFLVLLVTGSSAVGLTQYMLRDDIPAHVRALSLFHLAIPPSLLWMLHRWGYDRRGWLAQTALTWVVLPVTYALTEPAYNINWVFGPGEDPQHRIPPLAYLGVMMAAVPLLVYLPSHVVLARVFAPPDLRDRS